MKDLIKEWGRVCLGSLAGAGLGAVSFFAIESFAPPQVSAETIKAKIEGGLFQGPRRFIVVDVNGQEVKAKYTENVTTWCPFSCPWYDHPAIAYKACPERKAGDFDDYDNKHCITSKGKTLVFPDGSDPEDYSIAFQYKKGGLIQMHEFSIASLRNRQVELGDPAPEETKERTGERMDPRER